MISFVLCYGSTCSGALKHHLKLVHSASATWCLPGEAHRTESANSRVEVDLRPPLVGWCSW